VLSATRNGDDLEVRVRDDGRGLPPGFDPAASTGLGLQIVRTLVDSELGGTLSLRPEPGGGTRASLRLPLHDTGARRQGA
jgi:signal transduction histidine kinase